MQNQVKSMKNFFAKNWLNAATLFIAIVAIYISLRGNEIAFNASTSNVQIINDYGAYGIIVARGCFNKDNTNTPYQVTRNASEILTFSNMGGRDTSLIKASFSEGNGDYSNVGFIKIDPSNLSNREDLILPIDIESGKGRILLVQSTNSSNWDTVKNALIAINYPDPQSTTLPEIPKPALWKFEFSDGTTIIHEYQAGWYHIQTNIDVQMQTAECK